MPLVAVLSLLLLFSLPVAHAASGDPANPPIRRQAPNASTAPYPAESFHIDPSVIVASALGVEPERVSTWTLRMRLTEEQVDMHINGASNNAMLQVAATPCQSRAPSLRWFP